MKLVICPEDFDTVEIEMVKRDDTVAIVAHNKKRNASHTILEIMGNGTIHRIDGVTERLGFKLDNGGRVKWT